MFAAHAAVSVRGERFQKGLAPKGQLRGSNVLEEQRVDFPIGQGDGCLSLGGGSWAW